MKRSSPSARSSSRSWRPRSATASCEPIPLVGPFPSGAPAIFIDQVAKLGQPCGMIACVGADDFGRVNLDRLARDGVDTSAIAVHPELPDRQRLRPLPRRRLPRLRLQHPPQRRRRDRPDRGRRAPDRRGRPPARHGLLDVDPGDRRSRPHRRRPDQGPRRHRLLRPEPPQGSPRHARRARDHGARPRRSPTSSCRAAPSSSSSPGPPTSPPPRRSSSPAASGPSSSRTAPRAPATTPPAPR